MDFPYRHSLTQLVHGGGGRVRRDKTSRGMVVVVLVLAGWLAGWLRELSA